MPSTDPIAEQYMSVPEISRTLRVAELKVRQWIETGELPATNVSNGKQLARWRVRRGDLHAFLHKRSRQNQEL